MNFNTITDKIVFKSLKFIKYGSIELVNYDNKKYIFGSSNKDLKVKIEKLDLSNSLIINNFSKDDPFIKAAKNIKNIQFLKQNLLDIFENYFFWRVFLFCYHCKIAQWV